MLADPSRDVQSPGSSSHRRNTKSKRQNSSKESCLSYPGLPRIPCCPALHPSKLHSLAHTKCFSTVVAGAARPSGRAVPTTRMRSWALPARPLVPLKLLVGVAVATPTSPRSGWPLGPPSLLMRTDRGWRRRCQDAWPVKRAEEGLWGHIQSQGRSWTWQSECWCRRSQDAQGRVVPEQSVWPSSCQDSWWWWIRQWWRWRREIGQEEGPAATAAAHSVRVSKSEYQCQCQYPYQQIRQLRAICLLYHQAPVQCRHAHEQPQGTGI